MPAMYIREETTLCKGGVLWVVSPLPFSHCPPSVAWLQKQNGWSAEKIIPHKNYHEVVLIFL